MEQWLKEVFTQMIREWRRDVILRIEEKRQE